MSELIGRSEKTGDIRRHLLATVSIVVLVASVGGNKAIAQDEDRPIVWIELGGQLEHVDGRPELFAPPSVPSFETAGFQSFLPMQHSPRYSYGAEGALTFMPKGSDWILSASVRYGRSNNASKNHGQLPVPSYSFYTILGNIEQNFGTGLPAHQNAAAKNGARHVIVDFQAGKDLGLGMFSRQQNSVLSFGLRFAQFTTQREASISGVPSVIRIGNDFRNGKGGIFESWHRYVASIDTKHDFNGVGPSLSWKASTPISGNGKDAGITLDWGLSGAMLFGRQTVRGEHSTSDYHYKKKTQKYAGVITHYAHVYPYNNHQSIDRSHSVIVPNVGATAGASFHYQNAKVSFGYRADFFFGAMDGSIDARKTYDRNFYGPYATISIGLGG